MKNLALIAVFTIMVISEYTYAAGTSETMQAQTPTGEPESFTTDGSSVYLPESTYKTDRRDIVVQRGIYLRFGRTVFDTIMVKNRKPLEEYFDVQFDWIEKETDPNSEQNKSLELADEKKQLKNVLDGINSIWNLSFLTITPINVSDDLLKDFLLTEEKNNSPPFTFVRDVLCLNADVTQGFFLFFKNVTSSPYYHIIQP